MSNTLEKTREAQLEDLTNFTTGIDKEIIDVTATLNWTISSIQNDNENLLVCPYDSSHRVSKESFDPHLESCQWKAEGYREYDIPLSEPATSSDTGSCIKLDMQLQSNVLWNAKKENPEMKTGLGERLIPRTSDRLLTDFTSDERRALYDYVVSNTVKPEIGHDSIADVHRPSRDKDGNEDRELSFLELLVQERNLKRRRAKHRGVHTNKKSHIEILREVINQQMELYANCIMETSEAALDAESECNGRTEDFSIHTHRESSSRHRSHSLEDAYKHRNRNHEKYERLDERHSSRSKSHKRREKYSPTQKRHKRHEDAWKSRSKERSRSKEDKRRSKYSSHRKHEYKSRDSSNDVRSRHSSDRRRER